MRILHGFQEGSTFCGACARFTKFSQVVGRVFVNGFYVGNCSAFAGFWKG